MRKIAIGLMSTLSGLVLLFSYHTSTNSGTALASTDQASSSDDSASSDDSSSGSSSGSSSDSSSDSSSGSSSSSGTFTGDAVMTRWGVVQVEITVENGKITKSEAVQYPQENHKDVEINSYAVPILNDNAVAAQSADLDAISGATVTTDGYVQSLQSAIDQAHL
jgi:uncharacterized protein with FMN-binding domain